MTDGRWVCGGLDRNGLRPMRYVVTADNLLIAGSEAGMVPVNEAEVREKGALGPGQMIAVDMRDAKLYHDRDIKDRLAASQPLWRMDRKKVVQLNEVMRDLPEELVFTGEALRRRQIAAGYTVEEIENVLSPMAEDGKEAIASMGDDTPPAVLSGPISADVAFLPPELQPGDQPADRQPARNPGDEPQDALWQPQERAGRIQHADGKSCCWKAPFVANAEFVEMTKMFGDTVTQIDCTFADGAGPEAMGEALAPHPRRGRGCRALGAGHLVADRRPGWAPDRIGLPMILATSAVHSWLTRKGLRTFCSVNVRSAECIDPALFRGADRLRRDHGEPLSGAGHHRRADRARACWQAA